MNDTITRKPMVEEIKPYVAIGPTEELSVTLHKHTFDAAFITFTIAFILVLLIVVGLTIYYAFRAAALPPPPPPLQPLPEDITLNSNRGGTSFASAKIDDTIISDEQYCNSIANAQWNGICECIPPFFGPLCNREKHDRKYFSVGIPDESTLEVEILSDVISNGKSFNEGSCSDLCDKTEDCHSFIYHSPNQCVLLTDKIIIPENAGIAHSEDDDHTLYTRSTDNLFFRDRVFLGQYPFSFSPRYWLIREAPGYKQLLTNTIESIDFFPEHIKIFGDHTGIYCLHPFTINDFPILLKNANSSQCIIHHPNTPLKLPPDWKYKTPIYVMYD